MAGAFADISEIVNKDPSSRLNGLKFIKNGFSYKAGDDSAAGAGNGANGANGGNSGANSRSGLNNGVAKGYEDKSETGYGDEKPDNEVNSLYCK